MKKLIYLISLILAFGFSQISVVAATGDILQTFNNPTKKEKDQFGSSIATVGKNILIGDYNHNGGTAYLFDINGTLLHTFNNPTPTDYDYFGYCVAAMGNNILIGALNDDFGTNKGGAAYLFDGQSYNLLHTFNNPGAGRSDMFGLSITTVGNKVVIGAPGVGGAGKMCGAVYVFDSTTYKLAHTINNPKPEEDDDQFGFSLAAVNSNIAISSKYHNTDTIKGHGVGTAYLFDTNGVVLATFENPDPNKSQQFGQSMAALGNNVLIGADLIGTAAYLFDPNGSLLVRFRNPEAGGGGWFGQAVAALGNNVLIGARGHDNFSGDVYLFDGKTGDLLFTFQNPTREKNDGFGNFVTTIGNNILIGAPGDHSNGNVGGAVYLIEGNPYRRSAKPAQKSKLMELTDGKE